MLGRARVAGNRELKAGKASLASDDVFYIPQNYVFSHEYVQVARVKLTSCPVKTKIGQESDVAWR